MTRFLVAVVDGAKAKFLTLEPVAVPEVESGPDLIERCELLNPATEIPSQDLGANTSNSHFGETLFTPWEWQYCDDI